MNPQLAGGFVLASSRPLNNMRVKLKGGDKLPTARAAVPEKVERAERVEKLEKKGISPYWSSAKPDPSAEMYRVVY